MYMRPVRIKAGSWGYPRQTVAKVGWHLQELVSRVGFIVTNLAAKPEGVAHFYNWRGTAKRSIKEGRYALNRPQLFCYRFGRLLGWRTRMATGSGCVIVLS